jgi:hypothetical protein
LIGRGFAVAVAGALALLLLAAQPALATFHEMMIREVYPGSAAHPGSQYVELQMWAPGQNFVGGHQVGIYDATGAPLGTATFAHDVSGDASQSTLVAATPEAEAEFGFAADAGFAPGLLEPSGGAVCWETLDCVAWGDFKGAVKSAVGQPAAAAGIPDGMALRRTIEPGCPTLLEPADDRDNSAVDFAAVFPSPRPNSVGPSEHACTSQPTVGGNAPPPSSSPGKSERRPQTRLRRAPAHLTHDRTPTFRFASSIVGSTYLCKLDRKRFQRCHSPFTTAELSLGRHVFKVEARAPGGAIDRSAAAYAFKVEKPKRSKRP